MSREAMEMALEWIKSQQDVSLFNSAKTIKLLEEALAQPEPEPEPAAWAYKVNNTWEQLSFIEPPNDAYDDGSLVPLYTAPSHRNPLSDEEMIEIMESCTYDGGKVSWNLFGKAIEAAHGIKEKNT